jgi:type VI secretion system protein
VSATLYDVLLGRYADGTPLETGDRAERQERSVVSHLRYLFNTRRGSLLHLPAYGLPDVTEIYRELPISVDPLRDAIKETIERYEPRLKRVRVEQRASDPFAMRLVFLVSGETRDGERLRFETTFSSNDPADVQPAPAP